jgi:uncharacterized repeat protein (TIGR01451 family)
MNISNRAFRLIALATLCLSCGCASSGGFQGSRPGPSAPAMIGDNSPASGGAAPTTAVAGPAGNPASAMANQSAVQLASHTTPGNVAPTAAYTSPGNAYPRPANAYTGGYVCPPGGGPASAAHHSNGCTAGCCGTAGPVYPNMPPMSSFGLDPQEFLCDGGDQIPQARVRLDDAIIGVGLEDTVVKYETADGSLHVTPSNRVCIYAPRFASVRRVTGAVTDELATGPVAYIGPDGPGDVLAGQPSSAVMGPIGPEHSELAKGPDAFRSRDVGVPVDMVNGPVQTTDVLAALVNLSVISDGVLRDADKPWLAKGALAANVWTTEQSAQVVVDNVQASVATVDLAAEGITAYKLPGGRLRVIKVADRHSAQVGEIVTFVLRIDNTGEGPLDNVVLTDNLTTRMQYVPDSQTCTKGVQFETVENEGGSLRLTWKFTDNFKVGEGAIIRFRCRVR